MNDITNPESRQQADDQDYPYGALSLRTVSGYGYFDEPNMPVLDGSHPFTITAWIYAESMNGWQPVISRKDGVSFGIIDGMPTLKWGGALSGKNSEMPHAGGMGGSGITKDYKDAEDAGSPLGAVLGAIEAKAWNYISAVYERGEVSFYCNGIFVFSDTLSAPGDVGNGGYLIGKGFHGYIRSVVIYTAALPADQISERTFSFENASMGLDLTINPPVDVISGKEVEMLNGADIVEHDHGAVFRDNGYLDISDDSSVNPAGIIGKPYTIQAWIYPDIDDETGSMAIFSNTDSANTAGMRLYLEKRDDGFHLCLVHGLFGQETNRLVSDSTLPNRQWSNVAATFHGTTGALYINARLHREEEGLFPMLGNLGKRRMFIGSDVDSGSENGVNVFRGCISRIEVWDRALTNEEVYRYMGGEPQYDDGLVGQWVFCQGNYVNQVTFSPAARRRGLEIGIGRERHLGDGVRSTESQLSALSPAYKEIGHKYEGIEMPASCMEEAGQYIRDGRAFFVNHFADNGKIFFVVHYRDGAYIAMDAEGLDEEAVWYVELILLVVGGVINLICGARIVDGEAARAFITMFVISCPSICVAASGIKSAEDVPKGIAGIIKAIWEANVLRTLLRLCFSFSFFTILQITASMLLKFMTGSASLFVELGVLTASVMAHLLKYPKGKDKIPQVRVREIVFHSRNGYEGSHYMRSLFVNDGMERAEWRAAPMLVSEPILYDSGKENKRENVPQAINVWISYVYHNLPQGDLFLRCVDITNPLFLGMSDTAHVFINGGNGVTGLLHLCFQNHQIHDMPIQTRDIRLRWEYSLDNVVWHISYETNHLAYVALNPPGGPWFGRPVFVEYVQQTYPQVQGALTGAEVGQRIVDLINAGMVNNAQAFRYDNVQGASRYLRMPGGNIDHMMIWNDISGQNDAYPVVVNCLDCAAMVTLLSDIWGCNFRYMELFNATNAAVEFSCNAIIPIGFGDQEWQVPFGYGFSYHAVSVDVWGMADNSQLKIFDACLKVDAQARPWENNNKQPLLPRGMAFSQYTPNPMPGNVPVPVDSYREHLCRNDGYGACVTVIGLIHNFIRLL